jgi:enamine deaminase RidA (YjgF/YER057c/UK114 family)
MPTGIEFVSTPALPDVLDYAAAATVDPSTRVVFTAGAGLADVVRSTVAPGDVVAQAYQVVENLRTALAAAGAGLADVVRMTVYVASGHQADLVAAWKVVRDAFGSDVPPATLLGVAALGYDDQLVEVDAVAAVRRPG